jgi:two-component system, NtrC family, response regulator HydG
MRRRLLVVDDDDTIRDSLVEALSDSSTEIAAAESAERALSIVGTRGADVVLTDVRMAGMDGVELLRLLRERVPDIDVVLMTAFDDMTTVVSAMREGAVEVLVKPLDLHELRRVLARVFEDRQTRTIADRRPADTVMRLPEGHSDALIGHDPRMIAVFKLIGHAAANPATVLIRGESGTGKELIARAIHANSTEASAPFIGVNCAAMPATLLESELFGHVRGAFTGATSDRKGRFALAGRGTIFLDEIGDTSVELQAKLLRVLQEREFYPVGAERPERTEARVIAATHRDLEQMRASGEFRTDLYFRLRVVEIAVPPLRERVEDIPLLARHLVRRASIAAGREPPVLSDEAVAVLMRHEWPGNVRELENCLTRAVLMATSDVIRAEHVDPSMQQSSARTSGNPRSSDAPANASTPGTLPTLESLERAHVERVLATTQGHKARAAAILGISRPRLDRLLRKYGLE